LATQSSSHGKSALSAPKLIQKHSSLKKADLPAKLSEYVAHAMFEANALSTRLAMMSASVSGAVYLSVSVAV
jgi:hypothetical protein